MAQSPIVRQPPDDRNDRGPWDGRLSLPRRLGWASSFLCLSILASLVATSAWLFGGVVPDHQYGFAAAALLAVAAGTAWVAGASVLPRVNGVVCVLGLAVALAVLQLVPLSAALRAALSPETARWQERLTDPRDNPSADLPWRTAAAR